MGYYEIVKSVTSGTVKKPKPKPKKGKGKAKANSTGAEKIGS
jgi:hypothetical protein